MRKSHRKLGYIIYALLIAALLVLHSLLVDSIPDIVEYRLNREKGKGITMGELADILPDGCSFHSEKPVKVKGSSLDTKLVMMSSFSGMKTMPVRLPEDGIVNIDAEAGKHYAVISRRLALELFFTAHCVGQKISLDDTEYTVAGVYESSSPRFVRDGYERVYTVCSSVPDWRETPAEVFCLPKDAAEGLELLRLRLGTYFEEYETQDCNLPTDTLFDASWYWEVLVRKIQLYNREVLADSQKQSHSALQIVDI